jgi:hypothetical protein
VALAPNGDLVVVDEGAARILVLAFPTARLRHVIACPGGAPSAIAFDAAGRAYVADPVLRRLTRFDRRWRRDPAFPDVTLQRPQFLAAADSGPVCGCGGTCGCACASGEPCAPLGKPAAVIHVLDNGRLLSLDSAGRPVATDEEALRLTPPPLRPGPDGVLSWADPARPGYEPIRLPGLALGAGGRHEESGLPLLALPRRVDVPRFGAFTTLMLDSGRTGFAWDRITLVARLPEATRIVISTLTSEVPIAFDRWRPCPRGAGRHPWRWSPAICPRY